MTNPAKAIFTCQHVGSDGKECGKPAHYVSGDFSFYTCAKHARERRKKRQADRPNADVSESRTAQSTRTEP